MAKPQPSGRARAPRIDLHASDRQLHRQRVRAGRLWRNYQATDLAPTTVASTKAHQAWSDAVNEALVIVETISRQQAHDLGADC